ncbi:uncharacterized protein B0H18DRAFT_1121596 [Fomitopsis serialis]|uniref:uncharacterized protein n=1 Tax=Fomitopsis serialis TaxID=139415 RepID=UPI002007D2E9|nr:uncharacterized protein B0H18DRAFT_1121596 [Neoantrodia serialis]KAH9921023.1 hypothetical protein B0H18DRAFT_1121596 [Neoantrodia serialis]
MVNTNSTGVQSQLLLPYPPPYLPTPSPRQRSTIASSVKHSDSARVPSSHQVQHHPPERYLGPPPPRPGFVTRTVPQHVWDPYTKLRSRKNAMDVTLHFCPDGITPLDTQRITFDLAGQIPGTGIPLALQRIEGGDFEVEPVIPTATSSFVWRLFAAFHGFFKASLLSPLPPPYAQAAPNATTGAPRSDLIWAFGPGGLSFDNVSLVALYQMAGQFFLGEFYAELPRDVWDRHLDTAPVPMTY